MLAELIPTSLSPTAALACLIALSTPSVTKMNGDPSCIHSFGGLCVTTKHGDPGGVPPHAPAMSNILRPQIIAPMDLIPSRKCSALSLEIFIGGAPGISSISVSPLEYHRNSASPPSPNGF